MKILSENSIKKQIEYIKKYITYKIKSYVSIFNGNINGNIIFNAGDNNSTFIQYNNQFLKLGYGTPTNQNGASIEIHSINSNGYFSINAVQNNSIHKSLVGNIDSLKWGNEDICTDVNTKNIKSTCSFVNGTNDNGAYYGLQVIKCGPVVSLSANIVIPASTASTTTLVSGLPKPLHNIALCVGHRDNGSLGLYVNTDGNLITDIASATTTESWYNGGCMYLTMN